jgi:hypothetical protein
MNMFTIASSCATASRTVTSIMQLSACIALMSALAACSPTGAPPSTAGNLRIAMPTAQDMVAQVRTAGATTDALDVTPLRDPQVEDLRLRAGALEAQSDYTGAAQAIAQAMALVPGDPELQQQAAEYALYQQDWKSAETFAQRSYDLGSKIGSLCRRNWTTLRFSRLARGDAVGVQAAAQQVVACTVPPPPVRM